MIVRTVLGDISPQQLGVTCAHEHLIIDSPLVAARWPDIHLPSVTEAVAELNECAAAGVRSVIDAMPGDVGRDGRRLVEISQATGVNVIATTGMHTAKYYEGVEWANDPADLLARRFAGEILNGMAGSTARAGIIKAATSGKDLTPREEVLFEAVGRVHRGTGAPVLTHCEGGAGAMAQIETLMSLGVPSARILLSHTDKVADRGYHREILSTGAFVEYDQSLRQRLVERADTADLVIEMWATGFGGQILLGTDGARRSLWATLGGAPGLAWLKQGFPELLEERGLVHDQVEAMFVTNPAQFLAFDPPVRSPAQGL